MTKTVKVIFPGNDVREIEPSSWQRPVGFHNDPLEPCFDIPGYEVRRAIGLGCITYHAFPARGG